VRNLIIFALALWFVGYCFYLYNGKQMFPDPHPDPPPAHAAAPHDPPATIKDVNGRLWKCSVKGGTYQCRPMAGRLVG
jgi:hypothetical protein